jgi:hypothetical protein
MHRGSHKRDQNKCAEEPVGNEAKKRKAENIKTYVLAKE